MKTIIPIATASALLLQAQALGLRNQLGSQASAAVATTTTTEHATVTFQPLTFTIGECPAEPCTFPEIYPQCQEDFDYAACLETLPEDMYDGFVRSYCEQYVSVRW